MIEAKRIITEGPKVVKIDGEEVVYYWEPVPSELKMSAEEMKYQDCPKAFAVTRNPKANAGIVVYAKFGGRWFANSGCVRFLIQHLIKKLKK